MEKEKITFSSPTRPQGSTFFSSTRPQVPREGKQNNPSQIRKDRERKEAWFAKKSCCSTSIQPANLAEENHSRLNLKKRADTQGSVETHPPESQLSEKINKEMNTDIIPREKDKHHKDEPWFPVYSLKKTL